ncbi:Uncharacterised protein [Mycobacterium tuberculosis]|nr:Uncharacterised protein [Mycobacterium tuberculosis]
MPPVARVSEQAPAECWCARTFVESTDSSFSISSATSASTPNTAATWANTSSQVPSSDQR